jgi:type III pantothenate kinase
MNKKNRFLVVDAGNTRIKVAVFQEYNLIDFFVFSNDELGQLKTRFMDINYQKAIVSSVRSKKDTLWIMQQLKNAVLFSALKVYPIQLNYETPETLGADRLANAIAAFSIAKSHALVIDIGTCLKFDFVSKAGIYEGGSISPGIQLRYKAMHTFTAGLPLLDETGEVNLIGKSTVACMHSGVMRGMHGEITQFISEYRARFEGLTIFVTGGDATYFDFQSKNDIFVNENLTLFGLYNTILEHA